MPNLAAAAAVWRAWLDWVAPWVMSVSAPLATASPIRNSSLRVLLPPVDRPVQSSRLIHRRGPPRCLDSRSIGSSGRVQMRETKAGKAGKMHVGSLRRLKRDLAASGKARRQFADLSQANAPIGQVGPTGRARTGWRKRRS